MTRAQIVERLARGLYEREKVRDRTSHEKQAEWEELNFGRRATRLHYADELFEILIGGLGFSWEMVDALRACVGERPDTDAGSPSSADARRESERAIEIIAALLPPRVTHGR